MTKQVNLEQYTDEAYLNYSMYVILDRAIPHVGDGLKPVQRRIIHAMNQLSLDHQAKYKKSARTIGDVLGKYHPHGDTACYEAMVMMAQPFSFRYPLVDGQGNWGSPDDPKSFAAMRYTEARLDKNAQLLLDEMKWDPVAMKPNFDGALQEPEVLPAQLPFALLNGTSGIAVGMACDIPPHNLTEIANAAIQMIDKPKAGVEDLMAHIQGPDFPTTAKVITSQENLKEIYATGKGSIKMRSNYHVEGNRIVVTDMPFKTSEEKVIKEIGHLVAEKKKFPVIEDILNESDSEHPCRVVIKLKKSAADQADQLMKSLYAHTSMESNVRINLNIIGLDGSPRVMALPDMLREWLDFRSNTVRKRTENQLAKVEHQKHLTEGLLTAFLNLDEVIRIIREEDYPKQELMNQIGVSDIQAEAILDTRLRKLAKLEEMELKKRHDELSSEQARLSEILSSESNIRKLIRKELKKARDSWGDERMSPIADPEVEGKASKEAPSDLLAPAEPMRVVLSENGLIRAGKGHTLDPSELTYKTGDQLLGHCDSMANREVALIDAGGRVYNIAVQGLPSARGYGDPVAKWIQPSGERWQAIVDPDSSTRWLISTSEGYAFTSEGEAMKTRNRKGKAFISQTKAPLPPVPVDGKSKLMLATSKNRVMVISLDALPFYDKGKGNRLTKLEEGERIVTVVALAEGQDVQAYDQKGKAIHRFAASDIESHWWRKRDQKANEVKGINKIAALVVAPGQE